MTKEKSMFLRALENTIDEMKLTSFHTQYRSQLANAGFRRQDFSMSDFKMRKTMRESNLDPEIRHTVHVDMDLVHQSKRTAFKRSSYYGKLINMNDIVKDPSMFVHLPLIFLDGKLVTSMSFRVFIGYCEVSFTNSKEGVGSMSYEEILNALQNGSKFTIMFTPNVDYSIYENDTNVLLNHREHLNELSYSEDLDNYIDGSLNGRTFAVNYGLIYTSLNKLNATKKLSDMIESDRSNMYVNTVGWKNLYTTKVVKGSDRFFRLDDTVMPIPKENILIFELTVSDDFKSINKFAHGVRIKQYYPHTYELVGRDLDKDKSYVVYIFYNKSLESSVPFANELSVYEKYMGKNPLDYKPSGIIHEVAKNYLPEDYIYDIDDYDKSEFNTDPTLYKIKKFEKWVANNPDLSKMFLKHQVMDGDRYISGFYLDMKYVNLEDKVRYHNKDEIDVSYDQEDFSEARYVFIIRRDESSNATLRFYIDGEFYVSDKFWYIGRYEYHYIPTRLVKDSSVIEVEKFEGDAYGKDVIFRRLQDVKMIGFDGRTARRNDIFVIDLDDNDRFLDKDDYVVSHNKNGVWKDLPNDSFEFIEGLFRIRIKNSNLLSKNLRVMFSRSSFMINRTMNTTSATETFNFKARYNNDIRQIRIFRNSRLLSQDLYDVKLPLLYGGVTEVNPGIMKYEGDQYTVDVTPNHYHVTYSQETIPKHGVIDLRGKLPMPLDFKWYDFYLNGRKLSINEIEILSPMLLAIRNVKSLRNFIILERNQERSMQSISEDNITVVENLYDIDDEFRDRVKGTIRNNENTEDDIITEIVTAIDLAFNRLVRNLLPFIDLINPDEKQIHSEWKSILGVIMSDEYSIFINPDFPSRKSSAIMINPDEEIEIGDDDDLTIIQ